MKRYIAFMGSAMFCIVCFSMYLMLETMTSTGGRMTSLEAGDNDMNSIERKMAEITADLEKNQRMIGLFKEAIQAISNGNTNQLRALQDRLQKDYGSLVDVGKVKALDHVPKLSLNNSMVKKAAISVPVQMCFLARSDPPNTAVQMYQAFNEIPFDNHDGGAWKQGYPITYNAGRWAGQPLKVFVVPHSHTDPGWLKTFERYYTDQTRHIFDNMVDKLEAYPKMKFVYAEISFFNLWWKDLPQHKRDRVKALIKNGQFEIMTGGWVMTDEANAHYYAMLDQLIEGHEWLAHSLDVKPRSGWAIDPFGHTPTMAYLLKRMGLKNMLIQRTHYSVKKYLAQKESLEFRWRQTWDLNGTTDMFTHMMPFYSYDVPHTCGPDPKICCQFDFKRLPGGRVTCPWKIPPVPITSSNLAAKAEILLDQYRKKSMLFKNNVVLIPLGDDFRYDKPVEWDNQHSNYQQLFDYMNSRSDWHVEAQFGTLSDYFNAVHERSGVGVDDLPANYPDLTGDFFTYADRDQHYWSGYFTSRPFYKRLDRVLEAHLRGAEILFSLANSLAHKHSNQAFQPGEMMKPLVNARRSLGLFQHHDGITGTAKDFVVVDYGNKLITALVEMKDVIRKSAQYLLSPDPANYKASDAVLMFDVDEIRQSHDSLPERTIVELTDQYRPVAFYNSLGHSRKSLGRVYVDSPHVQVKDSEGNTIMSQIDPFWTSNVDADPNVFKCSFIVNVPAMGLSTYSIRKVASVTDNVDNHHATTSVFNVDTAPIMSTPFKSEVKKGPQLTVESADLKVTFDTARGMMQSAVVKDTGHEVQLNTAFVTYGTVRTKEKSGAYLFLPDGDAKAHAYQAPFIRVLEGPLVTEVHIFIPSVEHTVRLCNSPGVDSMSIEVQNLVDIRHDNNRELAMRLQTDIKHDNIFYTDVNGFQVMKRKRLAKLPLQGNFYPMPQMAFIEDTATRLSVLTAQSLGVSSLKEGWLEIMQDRRLNQDDGRGLGQGLVDNKRTPNKFRILIERRNRDDPPNAAKQPMGYASLMGHMTSMELIHPIHVLPPMANTPTADHFRSRVETLAHELPCEVHPVNLRSLQIGEDTTDRRYMPSPQVAFLLHRLGVDCSYPAKGLTCTPGEGKLVLGNTFRDVTISQMKETSLSLMYDEGVVESNQAVVIPPMEIKAFRLWMS